MKMCSVDQCSDIKIEKKLNLTRATCRKCEESKANVVLQGKFPYCRECFLVYFQHKYSGGLGKAKLLRNGDKVLLAFSGSFSSTCLVKLIHTSLHDDRKKKTIFQVVLIFIDEEYNKNNDERLTIRKCISDLAKEYGFKLVYSCLTTFGENVVISEDFGTQKCDNFKNVRFMLSNISSRTARNDMIDRMRLYVLHGAAKQLNCNKIFTAETGDHIAIKILGNIAIGRGKQLSIDTGYVTDLNDGILLVRPLREFSRKEVAYYNVFHKQHQNTFPWVLEDDKFSSIQKLTESFVVELQHSFPSTVNTVVSTGGKLGSENIVGNSCILCRCSLDIDNKDLSAEEAMRISQLVTRSGASGFNVQNFKSLHDSGLDNGNMEELSVCYACRIVITESKMSNEVLNTILNGHKEAQLTIMHDEIKPFLL